MFLMYCRVVMLFLFHELQCSSLRAPSSTISSLVVAVIAQFVPVVFR